MPKIFTARGAQYTKVSEFVFSYNDTMVNTSGALKTLGSVYTDAGTFEIINLPVGTIISHGELIVLTQGAAGASAYTLAVGNSTTGDLYLTASDLKAAAGTKYPFTTNGVSLVATDLSVTAIGAQAGLNVQMTYANASANATAGKWAVRVYWTLEGKIDETYPQ